MSKFSQQLLHCDLLLLIFVDEIIVFIHQPLIFSSLDRVKFIESEFHLLMDVGEFVPDGVSFFLDFFPFNEDIIKLIF